MGEPRTVRADLMLLGAAGLWGAGFIAQRAAMEHVGPFLFNTLRYAIGAAILLPAAHLVLRRLGQGWDRRLFRDGLVLGSVLAVAAGLQQVGMVTTTASRAGFITGLYVLMVPGIAWCFGRRPTTGNLVGIGLAFLGLALFAGPVSGPVVVGDWFVLASAAAWAMHVVLIGELAPRRDPTALVGVQFVVAAGLSAVGTLAFEPGAEQTIAPAAVSIIFSGVFATAAAYTLQFAAQRHAPPTHATVLMSTEAVFAAGFGWMLLGEGLGAEGWAGGVLMLAGALVSQLWPTRRPVPGTGADPTPPP